MRSIVRQPFYGAYEISESYLLITATLLPLAYLQMRRRHIRVTLISGRLSPFAQHILDLFTYAIALIICVLISRFSWTIFTNAVANKVLLQGYLSLPMWPGRFIVFFAFSWLSLQFFVDIITTIKALVSRQEIAP